MAGTVLITGANGSLAIPAIDYLLRNYADMTLILTVRNSNIGSDANTARLHQTLAQFPHAKTSIHSLDLAQLPAVHAFARQITTDITHGKYPPLRAIICNAYHWNLLGDIELTSDGYEKTFQVNHVSHVAIILGLVGSFDSEGARVVLFSSDAHWPGKNGLEKYPPTIPDDLEMLIKPQAEVTKEKTGLAFQRYANSKLAITLWAYALQRHLERTPRLRNVTVVAVDPGSLTDSRSLRTNTPWKLVLIQKFVLQPLGPLFHLINPTMRTSAKAGAGVIELALGSKYKGEQGFFTLLKKDQSSPESQDESKQEKLWAKSVEWAGVQPEHTSLGNSLA